jgi:ABC-type bacteriocin/lantibiotic exporter with double-glycine peptidase domain
VNAARALGIKLTEREVRAHTGTTKKDGTNEHGIKSALERLGFSFHEIRAQKGVAFDVLFRALTDGSVGILSVEEGRHWAAAIGIIGERVITFDSWTSAANKAECGIDVLNRWQLTRWWVSEERASSCYAIVFKKKP